MLETRNSVDKYTQYQVTSTKALLILLMSALFLQKVSIFGKSRTFTQSNSVKAVLEFLVLFSFFVRQKVTFNESVSFTDYLSGNQLLDFSKLAINQKNDNDGIICKHGIIINFFDVVLFLLSSLVTGPSSCQYHHSFQR